MSIFDENNITDTYLRSIGCTEYDKSWCYYGKQYLDKSYTYSLLIIQEYDKWYIHIDLYRAHRGWFDREMYINDVIDLESLIYWMEHLSWAELNEFKNERNKRK